MGCSGWTKYFACEAIFEFHDLPTNHNFLSTRRRAIGARGTVLWHFCNKSKRTPLNICIKKINLSKIGKMKFTHFENEQKKITLNFEHGFYGSCSNFTNAKIQCTTNISWSCVSQNWIYPGRKLDPIFWRPSAWYFSRNHGNSLDPIRQNKAVPMTQNGLKYNRKSAK